jgi:hypothetical protein
MLVQVNIAGSENKASSQLKRILAQLVLSMFGGSGPFPRHGIIAANKMQERALTQAHGAIRLPLGIDQKRESDSSLLAKNLGVVGVAEADGGEPGAFIPELLFVAAQLRDVLAAEDSSVVAQEDDHRGTVGPERAEAHSLSGGVRQDDFRERFAYCCLRR